MPSASSRGVKGSSVISAPQCMHFQLPCTIWRGPELNPPPLLLSYMYISLISTNFTVPISGTILFAKLTNKIINDLSLQTQINASAGL